MERNAKKISIVIPIYQNELNLAPLYEDIKEKLINRIDFEYEIVMVNDGSTDNSWEVMKKLANKDQNIKLISLSKNFGSQSAILCGLTNSTGDCAIVKAADLQEPTDLILEAYEKWGQGYNVVLFERISRYDKSILSSLYYKIVRKFITKKMPKKGFDTFLLDKKAISVMTSLDEKDSILSLQILWIGFKTAMIEYARQERQLGKSQWTFTKKLKLALDSFYSFSSLPITLVTIIGALSLVFAILCGTFFFLAKITGNIQVSGYTSIMLFILFAFGTIMLTLGILGGYIWRILNASRNRPLYIIEEKYEKNINNQ